MDDIRLGITAEEKADGVVSAGATGGFLSAATLILKKIPGVLRPALITAFPNLANNGETFVTILDVGASNENTPEEMAQFGYMGATFSESVYGIKNPVVKTLANGIEEGKALQKERPLINCFQKIKELISKAILKQARFLWVLRMLLLRMGIPEMSF